MSEPAIGSDGTIYVGSTDKKLYAIGEKEEEINQLPITDAGDPNTVNEGDIVQFDGSTSYDPDGIPELKVKFDRPAVQDLLKGRRIRKHSEHRSFE